jgi:hypothetical protein
LKPNPLRPALKTRDDFGAIRANLQIGRGLEVGGGDGKTAIGGVASGLACPRICPLFERLAAKPLPVYRKGKRLRIAVEFHNFGAH